jgi:hypothetical protein
MKIVICFLAFSLFQTATFSQTPVQNFGTHPRAFTERKSFWTEFNFMGTLSKDNRWQYQMDYQYRRSADASYIEGGSHGNIFKQAYQQVFRPWIHYWLVPGAVKLSLSPIGYWVTWTPTDETALYPNKDGASTGQTVYPEFRFSPQIMTYHNIGRVQFIQRYRYEFRYQGERRAAKNNLSDFSAGDNFAKTPISDQTSDWYGNNHLGRLRIQMRLQVPLNKPKVEDKTFYINAWNEIFIATGPRVSNSKLLNQNRVIALLGYRFNGAVPIRLEGGISYQTIFQYNMNTPPTNPNVTYQKNNVENNTAFTLYVVFDEFHKLFSKKEETN